MKLWESYPIGRNPIQKGIQMDENTNQKKTVYYILLAIGISILSLTLSIINLIKKDHVGRYRSFGWEDSTCMYVLDTQTSRLFLRGLVQGKFVCLDLGTVEQPLARLRTNDVVGPQEGHTFIPDKPQPGSLPDGFILEK